MTTETTNRIIEDARTAVNLKQPVESCPYSYGECKDLWLREFYKRQRELVP